MRRGLPAGGGADLLACEATFLHRDDDLAEVAEEHDDVVVARDLDVVPVPPRPEPTPG